jgi:ATP synthase I chain
VNLNLEFPRLTRRLAKIIVALTIIGSGLAGLLGGWTWAAGFLIGGAASYFNFRNLVGVVEGLGQPHSTGRVGAFAWLLLRLIVLAAGAFVIIKFTRINIIAVFAGLAVPVAAVILETILELTYAR